MSSNKMSTYNEMKNLCKSVKYSAIGDFWYENGPETVLFKIYHYTIFTLFYIMTALECLEMILKGYPTDLHNDAVSYSMGHVIVFTRINIILHHKAESRRLVHDIVKACEGHEQKEELRKQYRKISNAIIFQIIAVVFTMTMFIVEGIRRMNADGSPFVAVVTYFPTYEDRSQLALAARLVVLLIQTMSMYTMIAADSFVISHLIILSYKFVTLRKYFEDLARDYNINRGTMTKYELTIWFKESCLEGFTMHRELIRLSKVIYDLFGIMMSIQVCQCSLMIILILLRMTLSTQIEFTAMVMSTMFIGALLVQLALYLWNAGEITFQASRISTAIFHCGWYMSEMEYPNHNDVRRLILMGCAQAQRPIVIKAFGVHDLSYQTFVTVVRTTYSLFAVLH